MEYEKTSKWLDLIIKVSEAIMALGGLLTMFYSIIHEGGIGVSFLWGLVFLTVAVVVILMGVLKKRNQKIEEKDDFLTFLHFLFNHKHGDSDGFTLLPRMCLQIDRDGIVNPIHIKELKMSFSADMTQWDKKNDLTEKSEISYEDTQTFEMDVLNSNLPERYFCYMINAYSDKPKEFIQWHGNHNANVQDVNVDRAINKTGVKSQIGIYDWELEKRFITHTDSIPINFRVKCDTKERASSTTIIIIYPRKYGAKIDNIEVNMCYISDRIRIKNVTAYHIGKKANRHFGLSSIPVNKQEKTANVEISKPKCSKTDAYYVQVEWTLIDSAEVQGE